MLRIIGDVHCQIDSPRASGFSYNPNLIDNKTVCYKTIIQDCEYSVQLGDLGFGKTFHQLMGQINENKHKVVLGNHDDYSKIIPHSLGDYGIVEHGGIRFGFVRGANSIDKHRRTPFVDWWPNEQLDYKQAVECLDFFKSNSVDLMITHECPSFLLDDGHLITKFKNIKPSTTALLLDIIYDNSNGSIINWFFGHHHVSFDKVFNGTRFRCLNELEYFDYE